MKNTVMIIDDHEIFRNGLKNLINTTSWGVCCGEAGNVKDALHKYEKTKPDILLLDLYIDGCRSFENIPKLKKASPLTKIVILTVSEDEEDIYEATQQGIEGYILKNVPFGRLETYLIDIIKGSTVMSESLASVLFEKVTKKHETKPLTERENEVLALVVKGCSNKDIARKLYISVNTVKNHISNIMKKTNASSRNELAAKFLKDPRQVL